MSRKLATARPRPAATAFRDSPPPRAMWERMVWLDGRPLLDTLDPYRAAILDAVLYTFDGERPLYNFALNGRAKKNWKTTDLCLAALYRLLAWHSPQGNDGFILANDEGQAADDLSLIKKLLAANPELGGEVEVQLKTVARRDGRGTLSILPARDAAGAHGKTAGFIGFDEIHAYRTHDLFEALAPDPTRHDALVWVTSYAGIRHAPGIPLYDFMRQAKGGEDPRMFLSWYAGDWSTDPTLTDATPEVRANPSMASWNAPDYLPQQKRRLPAHKYRRLHLNMPGAPDGAAFNGEHVLSAIVEGRRRLAPEPERSYRAFVDMSGGSSDDAVLGIAFYDDERKVAVLASIMQQATPAPFNPRLAVEKFAVELKLYGLAKVTGDNYAGNTFKTDFAEYGIEFEPEPDAKSKIYEDFEPRLNAGEVELLDHAKLQDQLLTLVWRGSKIDHQPGDHDDWANAACGAIRLVSKKVDTFDSTYSWVGEGKGENMLQLQAAFSGFMTFGQ